MKKTSTFRTLIEDPQILMLPGVHDVLSAKIAEQAGFDAITCGGYSISATLLGQPDTSQLSVTEMADQYGRLCDAVSIPVFGDGDTGFGNVTNTVRTVRLYERAGLAGMFIEDQVFPKRCGHMAGKDVIETDAMLAKLKAALDTREDPDFVIMARTDTIAVNGIDDAIDRLSLFREAGADLLFADAPQSVDEMRRLCHELEGPVMANMIDGGKTPIMPIDELAEIGFAVATYSLAATYVVARALKDYMAHLATHGTTQGYEEHMLTFDDFNEIVGLGDLRQREALYLSFAELFQR
ncbi:MAG: carboxyvinyl-carboxyphosphonate phosphorylmutase [marine bacterium B5-7]|nr:MAG: carboxyvinyl-carboxyphosphonate phosphorylmutase [marine bacterium B5-7]